MRSYNKNLRLIIQGRSDVAKALHFTHSYAGMMVGYIVEVIFVINVANYTVLWVRKLQTETALSTMEAELNALAHS